MPLRCADYQARFRWAIGDEGAPIADAAPIGGPVYVLACPLCGCFHELPRAARNGAIVTPRCLLREFASQRRTVGQGGAWMTMYADWTTAQPDAPAHTRIQVSMTTLEEMNARPVLKAVEKPKRQRASRPRSKAA